MKNFSKKSLLLIGALSIHLLLSACGEGSSSGSEKNQMAGPPSEPPVGEVVVIQESRNIYAIKRASNGFSLDNKGFAGGTTKLTSNQTVIKFSDYTVNLLVGDQSKTITPERLSNLIELYVAFFNRIPDANGMSYWIDRIKEGMSIDTLAANFYSTALQFPTETGYTAQMSNSDFVKTIYINVFGRIGVYAPTDAEVSYWVGVGEGKSKGFLVVTMLNAAHAYINNATWSWVPKLLDNKVIVGNYFAIQQGLNFNSDSESISQGMAIAAKVTSTDIAAAKALIGVTDTIDLTIAAPAPQVTIQTSLGAIVVELNSVNAPITTANFLKYTETSFYSNKIFHRVISNFMIQGGGLTADMVVASTNAPIKLEVNNGLSNVRGTIAMARTNILDSATSQFFINVVDNTFLDTSGGGYAVFGKVVAGMDVVDKIRDVPTTLRSGDADVPVNVVLIQSATLTQ
jgi:cyclophilin family peptidyl-prolyl cis-trans isomerase